MFAAGNKKRLAAAIWSFLVCATAQAVQPGIGASPSKLNLLYKVHGSVPVCTNHVRTKFQPPRSVEAPVHPDTATERRGYSAK